MQDLKHLPPHHPAFAARARQERAAEAARLVAALGAAIARLIQRPETATSKAAPAKT